MFDVGGVDKVIIMPGRRGINFGANPGSLAGISVKSVTDTLFTVLGQALDAALAGGIAEQLGQDTIDKFFAVSDLVRTVDRSKPLDLEMTRATVHIDISGDSLDVEDRKIKDWPGGLDVLTTPQGSKALQTFQLAKGAVVEGSRIKRGPNLLSEVMERCLLFPDSDKPSRLLITRSAIAGHERLLAAEDPRIRHISYKPGELRGIHLLTAIVATRVNYSDCIQISESAARKMACYRRLTQTVTDVKPITKKVKVGDTVEPGAVIAETMDRAVHTRRLCSNAMVTDITETITHIAGEPATRVRFEFDCVYDLTDGDKATTRHGNKGCVRIIPDREMPQLKIGEDWVPAEVCVNPFSFVSRRTYGAIREMMANKLGRVVRVEHGSKELTMEELAAQGLGAKVQARIFGQELSYPVFCGPLYWLRTDHHAREALSACGSDKPINFMGLNPDMGKAGQRMNFDIATVMEAKGLKKTHRLLHGLNVERGAILAVEDLMSVLVYTGQAAGR